MTNSSGSGRPRSRGTKLITIIGNLGADPEMRYTQSGTAFTNFRVAVNDYRRGRDGQEEENTDWFRVTCWGRLADIANNYLQRGSQVFVQGRFRADEWTGDDGKTRTTLEINADNLQLLPRTGNEGRADGGGDAGAGAPPQSPAGGDGGNDQVEPDDLPF